MSLDVATIAAWLADTDIAELELTGPGTRLHLRRRDGSVAPVVPMPAGLTVRAPEAGVFLHRHPLHDHPIAAADQDLPAGAILGLLRIGALLLPVTAPQPGRLAGYFAAHGTVVGYGDALLDLHPPAE